MYLKNLTVLGFKSFPEKTSLDFQPGVSAIVGPNGCGKSNLSDAIRWVLGEQSARALRGGEMADVIFNGTDKRKPLGMAEVSLTLGGVDAEHLRAAGVEIPYDEVTLTRRVYRDGTGEYFLNRTPCRLKDIQHLFMGTGVGRASYSIMAQGNITQILSSRPEERRLIFEEAAGITRFKSQKREALRKLESTEQNLVRIADLVREVKRQIGSLQRQAGRARRYQALQAELQHLDTQLARHHFDVLQAEMDARRAAIENLRAEIEQLEAALTRGEDELTNQRARVTEREHAIAAEQQRGLELKGEIEQRVSRIQFNEERIREHVAQKEKTFAEITRAEERLRTVGEELTEVQQRLAAGEAACQDHRQALAERQTALRRVETDLQRDQDALQAAQAGAFGAAQALSRLRNELAALDLQKQANRTRLEKLSAEKIQLEEERARLEARMREFSEQVASEKRDVHAQRDAVAQYQAQLQELQTTLQRVTTEQDAALQAQAETRTRLELLEQLESAHEGFDSGAQAALRHSHAVIGSLAERIRVADPFVVAIEHALGHHLQVVLTERPESAQQILAELTASKAGRASVAALALECPEDKQLAFAGDMAPAAPDPASRRGLAPGEIIPALAIVQTDPAVARLVRSLLGRTFIAADLATATHQMQNGHAGCDFVTLQGELLSRHGVYTGGYLNGHGDGRSPSSILGRKNQIARLRAQLAECEARVAETSRQRGGLLAAQTELQVSLEQAQTELRQQEVAVATHEGEWAALQQAQRVLQQKIETVVFEMESLATQEREAREQYAALTAQLAEAESTDQQQRERVATLTRNLEALRTARDAALHALSECKVALATAEQLCTAARQQEQALAQRRSELAQNLEQWRAEIADGLTRKARAEADIAAAREQIAQLEAQRAALQDRLAALQTELTDAQTDVATREADLRAQRLRLTERREQRGSREVELAQKEMQVQNLRERIAQKYRVRLDDVRSECITITFADEGPPRVQVLTPEEMAAAGAATDWEAVAAQVQVLERRLEEMGPVNLVAISEYEQTEERYRLLSQQHEDLVQARAQLLEVIQRINSQTRQMFLETFERIRTSFREMFIEFFGGGQADLFLVDENDVLESGIEIVARPPGKQLKSISLLSGGEQTMTAVALLFSIYQVKPSPFCVLDELDAQLDESNINRFIRVLQRFLTRSQFIIITHNKRTIGMADVLYGVTMEEQGVSKIVSVKFHKAAGAPALGRGAPVLVPEPAHAEPEDEADTPSPREETLEIAIAARSAATASMAGTALAPT